MGRFDLYLDNVTLMTKVLRNTLTKVTVSDSDFSKYDLDLHVTLTVKVE